MKLETTRRFLAALAFHNPVDALITLVEGMKHEGLNQVQIYLLFEEQLLSSLGEDKDAGYTALTDVMDFVVGWCSPSARLFSSSLSNEEIETARRQGRRQSSGSGLFS